MFNRLTPALIRAIIIFTTSLVVSAAIISISFIYMEDVEQNKQNAKREMRKWQKKINSSVENNQIIDEFESNFLKLVNQGVVGAEDRLAWFETIQDTAKQRGMSSVKYSISTQKLLDEANLKKEYSGIDVFKSVMSVEVKMAHEGDLFSLINNLKKSEGLFAVDKCNIEKTSRKSIDTDNNLNASCELGWYTFKGSNAGKSR